MAGNVEGNVEVTCNEQNTGWDLTSFEFEVDRIVGVRRTADDDVEYAVQWSSVTIRIGQADGYLVHSKVNGVPLVDFVQEYIQTDQDHLQVVWLLTWEPSTSFTRCMDAVLAFWKNMKETSSYTPGATEMPLLQPGSTWLTSERCSVSLAKD
ncbi:hypothetical protein AC578_2992 [Pseudocercospora eumusae]|uniref:Uncharacterized protein n=1 Tax=Pseudocercospora eumusae TaxID=321146 RepID=A0A139GXD0_9PEZI|nr:hypothetical protein AC578_2992 [Pseudocercospora eumusae]